ncbi:hypothetical protein Pmani_019938 [Petrolisthes manimaculis]|uniref:Uncharacterized protein n=1 Tax=Petrolisthes manimaculis TaxID=1843537 RepID=A0AAE1U525_9EUCA|nr:hypothetical protein Pmani_019938 [Petrolisthes manimaculis]
MSELRGVQPSYCIVSYAKNKSVIGKRKCRAVGWVGLAWLPPLTLYQVLCAHLPDSHRLTEWRDVCPLGNMATARIYSLLLATHI